MKSDKDMSATLEMIANVLRDHVKFKSDTDADAVALWIVGTYLMDHWEIFPFIFVTSPEPQCGKSTVMKLLSVFCKSAQMASKVTSAALYRLIERDQPTLIFDEADRFLRNNNDLNGVLNAGHARFDAKVIINQKQSDGNWEPKEFPVWCAKAIAGIGAQEDTLVNRSITIPLRRKLVSEKVKPVRYNMFQQYEATRQRLLDWATDFQPVTEPEMEVILQAETDRASDNWIPLAVIANRIKNGWPDKVGAAFQMIGIERAAEPLSEGIQLLSDVRLVLLKDNNKEITSSELHRELTNLEDSDWYCYNYGRAITQKWVTQRLKQFGITPVRRSRANVYVAQELEDAFNRYLQPLK